MSEITQGDGYAVGHVDDMGDQYGFRKVRHALDVTEFGVNAIAVPPGFESGRHYHDEQQELYFVHRGTLEMEFGDGTTHRLEAGSFARVDPSIVRKTRNLGDGDALYVIVGGKGGYVGRDGRLPEGETSRTGQPGESPAQQ
jgi:quercetin dioxygenase-like cupin family protein